jgi:FkbM family methyltransferase
MLRTNIKSVLLTLVNRAGAVLPKRVRRAISDFPGVLQLLSKWSNSSVVEVTSPEGYSIFINPLFHSNFTKKGELVTYEPEMRQAIELLTRPGFTAYDIGANVGVFSFLFLSRVGPSGQVYAFEPEINNNVLLASSINKAGATNITLDTRAIGDQAGAAIFDRRGGAFSGRLLGDKPNYEPTENVLEVVATTVDELVYGENYPKPDIVKIDVEGNEGLVLSGMQQILKDSPPIIICEMHSHLGDAVEVVEKLLRGSDYRLYEIKQFLSTPLGELQEVGSLRNVHQVVAIPAQAP